MIVAFVLAQLAALELRRLPVPEAHQGVAADASSVYAVANSQIARYDKTSGRRLASWSGDSARFPHLNSCSRWRRVLVCAASNYPQVPMRSQLLWFDAATLRLDRVQDLGRGYGSLTWLDRHGDAWWAGFAHYDGKGGEPGRDHRMSVVVRYSSAFKPQGVWRFPSSVLARFAPRSTSGGSWGPDGLLYVTGHDRPEIYALRVPTKAGVLEHIATVGVPTHGQAVDWDAVGARVLWSIDRKAKALVASQVPALR